MVFKFVAGFSSFGGAIFHGGFSDRFNRGIDDRFNRFRSLLGGFFRRGFFGSGFLGGGLLGGLCLFYHGSFDKSAEFFLILLALQIIGAATAFDDFVRLLSHGCEPLA